MIVKKQIDLKHHVEAHIEPNAEWPPKVELHLVKTTNNTTIENDEPRILFRGRDRLALPMLRHYRDLCVTDECNDFQLASIDEMIGRFEKFAAENAMTMKQPGITRGR